MRLTGEETTTRTAARKRAAVEVVARYEPSLRRTARRYSLSVEDAEDAFQRALEILLTKAPTTDPRELVRWTQTVTKHEALAVRRSRERSMGRMVHPPRDEEKAVDWVALVPAEGGGPDERAERREAIARSREALQALRPAERRALSLLAGGCSYAEIARITGFSPTKVNRCIAEGRERFRRFLTRSEEGGRCLDLQPLLSAFCDGEASAEEVAALREHLRACGPCRATMRAYRATPRAVAALAPAPFAAPSLLERARDIVADLQARLPGRGGGPDPAAQVAASGGAKGAGMAALAKAAAVCAGTAGGVAACVAAGAIPAPLGISGSKEQRAPIERAGRAVPPAPIDARASAAAPARRRAESKSERRRKPPMREASGSGAASAVDYTPPPEAAPPPEPMPEPVPASTPPPAVPPPSASGGSAAGEFGP